MTYDALIRAAAQRLQAAGIDESRRNAQLLLMHVSGLSHAGLIAGGADVIPDSQRAVFEQLLERRLAREPLQHILGVTHFYGLEIRTDARALIPRPDSECVVEAALDRLVKDRPVLIADLGTGTGCLLAALLSRRPLARGVGVEASTGAAELAQENLDQLGLASRAHVFHGSWTQWQGWGEADLIISNPPYIASDVIEGLEPEVRRYDPLSALDGGRDGLDAYREILSLAAEHMKAGSWLVFEIGHDQRSALETLMQAAGYENIASGQDLGGNDRFVAGQRSCSAI